MGKLSEIKAGKNRVVSGFWTPTPSVTLSPTNFDPTYTTDLTLSNGDYTVTAIGLGGFSFSGLVCTHDTTLRGYAVTLDITGLVDGDGLYLGAVNGNDMMDTTEGHLFVLVWNALNSNFDVMGGNVFVDTLTALGSLSYINGDVLYFGTKDDGTMVLYKNGALEFSMTAVTPMSAVIVSCGAYLATSIIGVSCTILQNPAATGGITQYMESVAGPIAYPLNPEGKIVEIEGVAPGGIVVDGFLLKNGMWVEFDQNGAIVSPVEPEFPYLTEAVADTLYYRLVSDFYGQMSAPGINDDDTTGVMTGSKWQDVSPLPFNPAEWYICSDPSTGAAVWEKLSLTVDELGSMALQSSGGGPTEYRDNTSQDAAISSAISAIDTGALSQAVIVSSPYYLQASDSGKVLVSYLATPVVIIISYTTLINKTFGVYQAGTGQVSFSGDVGWTLENYPDGGTNIAGQFAFASVYCYQNPDDFTYHAVLAGGVAA